LHCGECGESLFEDRFGLLEFAFCDALFDSDLLCEFGDLGSLGFDFGRLLLRLVGLLLDNGGFLLDVFEEHVDVLLLLVDLLLQPVDLLGGGRDGVEPLDDVLFLGVEDLELLALERDLHVDEGQETLGCAVDGAAHD